MQDTDPSVIAPTMLAMELIAIDTELPNCEIFGPSQLVTNKHLELLYSHGCLEARRLYMSTIHINAMHCKVNITRPMEISKSVGLLLV